MRRFRFWLLALLLMPASQPRAAAAADAAPLEPPAYFALRAEALRLQNAGDHRAAIEAYERLVRSYDGDGALWWELGELTREAGRALESVQAYRRAFELGFLTRPVVAIEIARSFAKAGKPDSAVAWIERANAHGYERRSELAHHPDFAALRERADFRRAAGTLADRAWSREEGWRHDLDYLLAEVKRLHAVYRAAPLLPGSSLECVL